ncbi:ankyrin repeat domain-containing protein [Caenimonas terrae]|uniref:Ankyrin repeat domain-containing protein n=1 Tax=Caenimonas terrae TaxID=696074 RepID=A0ABW0NCX2_9BURK
MHPRLLIAGLALAAALSALAQAPLSAPDDDIQFAIARRDGQRIAALVRARRPLDFNFSDSHSGRTHESPLTMAVNRDFPDIAGLLLGGGADPNRRDAAGRAPIHQARSAAMARLLVQAGADPNALDARGRSAVALAVERGDLAAVDALLAVGARLDTPLKDTDLLAIAIDARQPQLVRPLLERGFDVRATRSRAIWKLLEGGDEDTAVLLVQRGADPNARGNYGEPLLVRALFRQRYALAQALVEAGANLKLADAPDCARGAGFGCVSIQLARLASFNPPLLATLVARGLDLNTVDAAGHTALSSLITEQTFTVRAAGSDPQAAAGAIAPPDNVARAGALLRRGADPNIQDRGATPLMLAIAIAGRAGFVDLLLEHGGRIEFERGIPPPGEPYAATLPGNPAGATSIPVLNDQGVLTGIRIGPLTWAVLHGRADVALRLLARGEKAGPADRHLLYFAAALGQGDAVPRLLRWTREVNAADRAGVTPLMFAASAGNATAVGALLAAGARVNARSDRDWPPLLERGITHYFSGHPPSRQPLVGGYTALRAARERGHAEVARLLLDAGARD